MPTYVAYTPLGNGQESGQIVTPEMFSEEDGEYYVAHGNVVLAGGEKDPNTLEARARGVDYEDPRDARIAMLEAELEKITGLRMQTPAPGIQRDALFATDENEADGEETGTGETGEAAEGPDPKQVDAQAKVDQQ